MVKQLHINEKMRSILVDWIVEVDKKLQLRPETIFLTVNLLDRYLEKQVCAKDRLQLIGTACLFIASKYEEIYPPNLKTLVEIT